MSDSYTPIDCGLYDRYEAWAVGRVECRFRVRRDDGTEAVHCGRIRTLVARDGAEYAVLESGEELRLDRVVEAGPAA